MIPPFTETFCESPVFLLCNTKPDFVTAMTPSKTTNSHKCISGGQLAAHSLFHDAVGKRCYQIVHLLLAADIVGLVYDLLLLRFVQVGIAVHSRCVFSQSHSETNGNFVEIHSITSLSCRVQHIFNEDSVAEPLTITWVTAPMRLPS